MGIITVFIFCIVKSAIHLKKLKQGYGNELSRLNSHEEMMEYYKKITNKGHKNGWTVSKLKKEKN